MGFLLNARDAAFRSHDLLAYRRGQSDLREAIWDAKLRYTERIKRQIDNNNAQHLWRGIRAITGYRNGKQMMMSQDQHFLTP